jgi:signal transduction histidine kinase
VFGKFREALKDQPVGSRTHRLVFLAIASVAVLLEIIDYSTIGMWSTSRDFLITLGFDITLTASFVCAAFRPAVGGALVFLIANVEALVWSSIGWPLYFIYVVLADWIARKWTWQAVGFLAVLLALTYSNSPNVGSTVLVTAVCVLIATSVGIALRRTNDKVQALERETREAKEAALRARDQVQEELAAQLHDTAVRDLVRLVSLNDSPARSPEEVQAKEEMMGQIARNALRNIRATINRQGAPAAAPDATDVISICQRMLRSRNIELVTECPENLNAVVARDQLEVFSLVVQEGSTNILKYAPTGSQAQLLIDGSPTAGISIVLTNSVDVSRKDAGSLTGGFGLQNLTSRVEAIGGECVSERRGNDWQLIAALPPVSPVVLPRVDAAERRPEAGYGPQHV